MNIVFVHSHWIIDQYQVLWRCANIAEALEKSGRHHAALLDIPSFVSFNEKSQKLCSAADLIVIHRYNIGPVLQAALYWKGKNKKIIMDLDEAVDLIPVEMEQYRFWQNGEFPANFFNPNKPVTKIEPSPIKQIHWAMTLMDAVTVSSMRLGGDWEKHAAVCITQDYIDFDQYLTSKSKQNDEIWIGMGGDSISEETLQQSGLLGALEEVCHQRPQARLFLENIPPGIMERINIPNNQKVIRSWMPPEDWILQLSKLDIGLAPAASDYDLRKSNNRVLEYLANKIPWIASNRLPYRDLKEFGMLVENNEQSWINGVIQLIDSLDVQRKKAEGKPYLFAISQGIDENVGKILEVYESILKSK